MLTSRGRTSGRMIRLTDAQLHELTKSTCFWQESVKNWRMPVTFRYGMSPDLRSGLDTRGEHLSNREACIPYILRSTLRGSMLCLRRKTSSTRKPGWGTGGLGREPKVACRSSTFLASSPPKRSIRSKGPAVPLDRQHYSSAPLPLPPGLRVGYAPLALGSGPGHVTQPPGNPCETCQCALRAIGRVPFSQLCAKRESYCAAQQFAHPLCACCALELLQCALF
jgi:hypothetical protein